jgi:hypothetical protein
MVTPAKVCIGKRNEETSAVPSTVVGSDDLDTGSLRRRAARPAAAPAHPPSRAAATKWGYDGVGDDAREFQRFVRPQR